MRCQRVKRLTVHREKPSLSLTAWFFLWTECWVGVVLQMIEYSKASVPFVAVERCCGQLRQHDKRLREGVVVLIAHHNNATATTILARRLALQQVNACGQGAGIAIRLGSAWTWCASGNAAPRFTVPAIGRTACKPCSIQRRRCLSSTCTLSCCNCWMAD